jgi:predicted kinase
MISTRVIVITGLPSSGKSTAAERLAELVGMPLIAKDALKERLFDTLGTRDREWSRQLSRAAYALMFAHAYELARCKQGFILEGNFRWAEHAPSFQRLQASPAEFVQVNCCASPDVLVARFRQRALAGARHPGHVDMQSFDEVATELWSTKQGPLALDGPVVICDTTDDWQAAIERACAEVQKLVARTP